MGYKWNSFSVIDEKQIGDGNVNVGDSFVYGGAHAEMYVYDNDRGLAGDRGRGNNEKGSDYQPGWIHQDGEWIQGGNMYWEGYFTMRGSDGRTYYMIEIEGTCLDNSQDYFAFYGAVPPQGVTLTAQCYYGDCGSLSYACLDGGEIGSTPVSPEAANDFLAVQQGEGVDGADINILLNDDSNTGEALVVKEVDGSASVVGVWVDLDDGGRIMIAADGSVDFDAAGDFDSLGEGETATVSIDYTVINSDGLEDTATLTIEVTGVNDAPVAVDQAVRTDEDSAVSGNVLTGAFDVDGDAVSLDGLSIGAIGEEIAVTTASGYTGTIVVNADGTFTFTPGPDADDMETGEIDTFTFEFTVKSQNGTKEVATTRTIDFETAAGTATQSGGPGNPGNDKPVGNAGENPNGTGQAGNSGAQGNSNGFAIDPVTTTGGGELNAGDVITTQIEGVTISVCANGKGGRYDEAMIFDSESPTGGDWDLATSTQGNILIISEDGHSHDPDDNAKGGEIHFTFDEPTDVDSLTLIDNEEGTWIGFYDAHWNQIGSKWVGGTGDNSVNKVSFDGVNSDDVKHMLVVLKGSGAIDDLVISDTEEVPDYLYDTATVTVTIEGVSDNTAPIVEAQTAITDENTTVFGDLLDGATDAEGDDITVVSTEFGAPGSYSVTTDGGNTGTLTVTADGMFSFAPDGVDLDLGETDTITFSFTASDGELTSSATATVTITGLNAAPTVANQALSVNEANAAGLSATVSGGLLDGAADADGDVISLASVDVGAIGSTVSVTTTNGGTGDLTINADGTFTFVSTSDGLNTGDEDTLVINFTGESSGGTTVQSASGQVVITINGVNVDPVAVDVAVSGNEADFAGNASAIEGNLLADAFDADGDAISVVATSLGTVGETVSVTTIGGNTGELTINADGSFSFLSTDNSLDLGETDTIVFTYTAGSPDGDATRTDTAQATITINGLNVAPTVENQAVSVNEANDQGQLAEVSGSLLAGAADLDGEAVSLQSVSVGTIGSTVAVTTDGGNTGELTVNADGTFTFVSTSDNLDLGETDTLTIDFVGVSTGGVTEQTAGAQAVITINGVNVAPVSVGQSYVISEVNNSGINPTEASGNLLDGATDADGDAVSLSGVTAGGVAVAIGVATLIDTAEGAQVELLVQANGDFTVTALDDSMDIAESDSVSFQFTVESTGGTTVQQSNTSEVNISILGVNVKPVAGPVAVAVSEQNDQGEASSVTGNLLAEASDADGDAVSLASFSVAGVEGTFGEAIAVDTASGGTGTLVVNADGTFEYTSTSTGLDQGEPDSFDFDFTVQSSGGFITQTASSSATVNISGVNVAPVAINQAYTIDEDATAVEALLVGATDADGDAVSFVSANNADTGAAFNITTLSFLPQPNPVTTDGGFSGTLLVSPTGGITFIPGQDLIDALNDGDTDSFTFNYTVASNGGVVTQQSQASATITINGITPNQAPIAEMQTVTIFEDEVASGDLSLVTSDADGDALNYTLIDGNAFTAGQPITLTSDTNGWDGELTVNADGTYSFTPGDSFLGLDDGQSEEVSFTYTVSDGDLTASNTVTITVDGKDDDTGGPVVDPDDGADVNVIYLFSASASMFTPTFDCDDDGTADTSYFSAAAKEANELQANIDMIYGGFTGQTVDDDYYSYGDFAVEASGTDGMSQLAGAGDLAAALQTISLDTTKETRIYIFTDNVEDALAADAAAQGIVDAFAAAGTALSIDGVAIGIQETLQLSQTVDDLELIDTDAPAGGIGIGIGGGLGGGGLGIGIDLTVTSDYVDIIAHCDDDYSEDETNQVIEDIFSVS
ncbi:beta strand repeat-containing protein [Pontivivens insulae]|uniref:Cadherin domain-containing protein n=1 Tax=Pontivivens insulae TaxID=1639689 RepID=A0A2R8AEC5_9RHOB|nr:Ig-like domain-containing protein [Pontivivens insulae]RED11840.1 VCBS repeat-containing protein [Pontivivens insulae]SPF30597.1 hypothetical protein POI8812_02937 [Pontivivens insulae]